MQFRNSLLFLGLVLATAAVVAGCGSDDNKVPVFTRTSSSLECGVAPMDVQFVAIASGGDLMADPTGANSYLDISWDFGDGSSGNGSVTPHTFSEPGVYEVIVTVTDDDGDKSTSTLPVTVLADSLIVTTIADTSVVAGLDYFTVPTPRAGNVGDAEYVGPAGEGLVINEVLVFNETAVDDGTGSFVPYLEVLNTTGETISLNNYTLTNDPYVLDLHLFTDNTLVEPGEFQIVWMDGREMSGDEPHASFTLTGDYTGAPEDWPGTTLYLMAPGRRMVDAMVLERQTVDVSFGRTPDGLGSQPLLLTAWSEACDFDTDGEEYSRYDFTWTMNDAYDTVYRSRSPLHTFSTLDVGSNVVDLTIFDLQTSVFRAARVNVEVTAP